MDIRTSGADRLYRSEQGVQRPERLGDQRPGPQLTRPAPPPLATTGRPACAQARIPPAILPVRDS